MKIKTRHGIRVKGLISGMSADGKSRSAQPERSLSTKETIFAKKSNKKLITRNVGLSITDVIGSVSSSDSFEEEATASLSQGHMWS